MKRLSNLFQLAPRGTQAEAIVCRIVADSQSSSHRFAFEDLVENRRGRLRGAIARTRCTARRELISPLGLRLSDRHSDGHGTPTSRVPHRQPSREGKGAVGDGPGVIRDFWRGITALWCRTVHSDVRWPFRGRYCCSKCGRIYVVPWETHLFSGKRGSGSYEPSVLGKSDPVELG
jgi:hypothetical protein